MRSFGVTRAAVAALYLSLAGPAIGEPLPASTPTPNPYLYEAYYAVSLQRGPSNAIDLALTFTLSPGIALDTTRIIAKIRRVDGTPRAGEPSKPSASAPDRIDFPIPNVRGATYEFSFDAGTAVGPGAQAPSLDAIADQKEHDNLICQSCDVGMDAVNGLLVTIPSAPFEPRALARARRNLAGRTAYVWRKGLHFLFSPGSPHAGVQVIPMEIGSAVRVTTVTHGGFALASSGPLGVTGEAASLPRYVPDSIAVEITVPDYGSPTLTFASLEELQLYLRASRPPR